MSPLFVSGMSHLTAPVEVREQLALEPDKILEFLADLLGQGLLDEVMILSTCNRVEVYGVASEPAGAHRAAWTRLGAQRGLMVGQIRQYLPLGVSDPVSSRGSWMAYQGGRDAEFSDICFSTGNLVQREIARQFAKSDRKERWRQVPH